MIQLKAQINLILSNRAHLKLNNNVECVLCGSTLPWAEQARRSVLIYTAHTYPFLPSISLDGEHPASHQAANSHFLFMLKNFFGVRSNPKCTKCLTTSIHLSYQQQSLAACWDRTPQEQNNTFAFAACRCLMVLG